MSREPPAKDDGSRNYLKVPFIHFQNAFFSYDDGPFSSPILNSLTVRPSEAKQKVEL